MKRPFQIMPWIGALLLLPAAPPPCQAAECGLPAALESEQVENAAALTLASVLREHQEERFASLKRVIEDIQRVTSLPPERARLLQMAGWGLIERLSDGTSNGMRATMDSYLRQGGQRQSMRDVMEREEPSSNELRISAEEPAWKQLLAGVLSPAELQSWRQAVAARHDCRVRSVAGLVLLMEQSAVSFSEDEADKLMPLVEKSVEAYLPDLLDMFGASDSEPSVFMPALGVFVHGIDETAATAILGPERWKLWKDSGGRDSGNWPWIKTHHIERLRRQKP